MIIMQSFQAFAYLSAQAMIIFLARSHWAATIQISSMRAHCQYHRVQTPVGTSLQVFKVSEQTQQPSSFFQAVRSTHSLIPLYHIYTFRSTHARRSKELSTLYGIPRGSST